MTLKSLAKSARCGLVAAAAFGLSACGFDGVELNGKIFDAVGLNTGSTKSAEPKLKERQALVVPPEVDAAPLPVPGSESAAQTAALGISDYDAKNNLSKEALERKQAEFCAKNYDMAKAQTGEDGPVIGPAGDCRKSILSAIGGINGGAAAEDEDRKSVV